MGKYRIAVDNSPSIHVTDVSLAEKHITTDVNEARQLLEDLSAKLTHLEQAFAQNVQGGPPSLFTEFINNAKTSLTQALNLIDQEVPDLMDFREWLNGR